MLRRALGQWSTTPRSEWRIGPDGEVIVLTGDAPEPVVLRGGTADVWSAVVDPTYELGPDATDDRVRQHLDALESAGLIVAARPTPEGEP